MSTAQKADGNVLMVPSASGRTVNEIVEFGTDAGGFGGVALATVASGVDCPVAIGGIWSLTKGTSAGDNWLQGEPVYREASTNIVSQEASANHLIGVAANTVIAADTTADVLLTVGAIGL